MKQKIHTVIDLFAGCGGLSLGLYQAGWRGLFAIEKNEFAFETLRYNLIENKHHFKWPSWLPQTAHDINDVLKNYSEQLKDLRGEVDLVAGGPPCQGFSMAGKRVEDDIRNKLVFSYIEFIKLVQPKMILFENVKGFTYAFKKDKEDQAIPYSQIVVEKLQELDYDVKPHVIDFSEYGVPQRRKRFILVGIQKRLNTSASEFEDNLKNCKESFLKNKNLSITTTIEDAISDLLRVYGENPSQDRKGFMAGKYGPVLSNYQQYLRGDDVKEGDVADSHAFAKHTADKLACYNRLLEKYPVRGKRIDGKAREPWGILQRGITILDPKSVSPTITGHPDDYLHFSEPRIMTVRECARIQSFPDWYQFKKKYTTGGKMRKLEVPRYTQVGNAIPPLFAELAGEVLKYMLSNAR